MTYLETTLVIGTALSGWIAFTVARKKRTLESSLSEMGMRFRYIQDHTTDGIIFLKPVPGDTFEYTYFNRVASQSARRLEGNPYVGKTPFQILPKPIAERLNANYLRCFREKQPITYESTLPSPTGELFLSVLLVPILDEGGNVVEIAGFARDISELKRATREAEAANVAKTHFLANISHEIRTPLNSILGLANLMLTERAPATNAEETDHLRTIERAGRHLLDLLNQVLDLSKIETADFELRPRPFHLVELVRSIVELNEAPCRTKGVRLEWTIDPGLPQSLRGDSARLSQILMNLVSNAVKFTDQGRILIRVESAPDAKAGAAAPAFRIAVVDTGIGIPRDKQPLIFERFSQVDSSYARKYGGTGLGLHISKLLAERMGGTLAFSSSEGVGTTFTLDLPFEVVADENSPIASLKPSPAEAADRTRFRVLLVDDAEDNLALVRHYLHRSSIDLATATSGRDAIDLAKGRRFDLVLMDIQMPEMDGYATAERIHELDRALGRPATPILALTAHALQEHEAQSRDAGFLAHLSKPILKQDLLDAIERFRGERETIPTAGISADPSDPAPPDRCNRR